MAVSGGRTRGALHDEEHDEEEPGLVRGEERDEAPSGVVEEELEGFARAGLDAEALGYAPSDAWMPFSDKSLGERKTSRSHHESETASGGCWLT